MQDLQTYADRLGDQLELILGHGTDELEDIVRALNESDVKPPQGGVWTAENFVAELKRMGA
jgi:hypothetical protein